MSYLFKETRIFVTNIEEYMKSHKRGIIEKFKEEHMLSIIHNEDDGELGCDECNPNGNQSDL